VQIKCCADVAKRLLRASIYPLLLILLVSSFTLAITWHSLPYLDADSHWYVELAECGPVNVVKPFSNRILLPGIIHTLVAVCDLSTDQAFIFVAVIALILLATSVTLIMKSATPYPFVVLAVLCTPFLLGSFSNCYFPDLFHAALLGLFFFLILRDELW
jgi:hypothetical protein